MVIRPVNLNFKKLVCWNETLNSKNPYERISKNSTSSTTYIQLHFVDYFNNNTTIFREIKTKLSWFSLFYAWLEDRKGHFAVLANKRAKLQKNYTECIAGPSTRIKRKGNTSTFIIVVMMAAVCSIETDSDSPGFELEHTW